MPTGNTKVAPASQSPLFETAATECDQAFRVLVTEVIRNSSRSRAQVADEMSRLLGISVTERMLDCYTAESKEKHRFPAAFVPAFCRATADFRLLYLLAERLGFAVIEAWQVPVLELGERVVATRMSQREIDVRSEELVAARSRQ